MSGTMTPLNIEDKLDNLTVTVQEVADNIAENNGALVVDSPKTLQKLVRRGIIAKSLHPTDQIVIERETNMTINSSNTGLTVSVTADTFIEAIGEAHAGVYEFIYDGLDWTLHGSEVELAAYGISCSGTPAEGDIIAVHETAAQLVFDVLGIDQDTPSDPNLEHTLALQMHDCLMNLQFDAPEALMVFPEGLAAGQYYITGDHSTYGESTTEDGNFSFTITNAIPAGGYLRHSTMGAYRSSYNKSYVVGGSFITYNADYSTLETVATVEGQNGTYLGTVTARTPSYRAAGAVAVDNINATERNAYGRNYWKESAVRQMLNSKAAAGSVWTPQNKFDMPPSWRATQEGFLKGLDPELVSVLGRVKKRTGLNVWERTLMGANYEDTDELVWLPSFSEVYFGKNTYGSQVDEGGPYKFYSDYSDLGSAGTGADTNRIKLLSGSARYWWLRSPYPSYADYVYNVQPTGANGDSNANNSCGLAPAYCIV